MSPISEVKFHQQVNTPDSTTSASEGSLWNKPGATGAKVIKVENNNQVSATDNVETMFNKFVQEIVDNFKGATKDDVILIMENLGYPKEKVIKLSKNEFFDIQEKIMPTFEYIYGTDGSTSPKKEIISKLASYSKDKDDKVNFDEINDFADKLENADYNTMIQVVANSEGLVIPENIKTKLKNSSISDLSEQELLFVVTTIVKNEQSLKEKNVDIESLMKYILLTIPDSKFEEGALVREFIISTLEQKRVDTTTFKALIDKSKGSKEALESACTTQMIENLLESLDEAENAEDFFSKAEEILKSGDASAKSVLANSVGNYLKSKLQDINNIRQIPEDKRTESQKKAFVKYKNLYTIYQAATGYALIKSDKPIAASLYQVAKNDKEFILNAYKRAYSYSIKDKSENPEDVTARIDEITNNEYSTVLTELGYELPTAENIEALRTKAQNGTLLNDDSTASNTADSIGYEQSSSQIVENASFHLSVLREKIADSSLPEQNNNYIVEKQEPKENTFKLTYINPVSLSNFDGKELSDFISKGLLSFVDTAKQYTKNLSESGKRFVISRIKVMDNGGQTYALNSTNNTTRWEIMKKADLLDEDLNVNFDYNHEMLREKYMG